MKSVHHPNVVKLKDVVVDSYQEETILETHPASVRVPESSGDASSRSSTTDVKGKQPATSEETPVDEATKKTISELGLGPRVRIKRNLTVFLVFEYVEHDLATLMDHKAVAWNLSEIKQLLVVSEKNPAVLMSELVIF